MADLQDGESTFVQGSAKDPYELKRVGSVYSCTCPAWRNQSVVLDRRTCKHLKGLRGEQAEQERLVAAGLDPNATPAARAASSGGGGRKPAVKKETAPPVLLAHPWENDVDLTGWWMSEKLDGMRAYWTGQAFLSRNGNPIDAPDWFVKDLPDHPLDGELWGGRGKFSETMSVVRSSGWGQGWRDVIYVLFDAPALEAGFEERLALLRERWPRGRLAHVHYLEHERCMGTEHLRAELARVEALGGEGLMLRKPGSRYVAGRSSTLLKVKTFHDAEAKVVEHEAGRGRHAGRLGAVVAELPSGIRFNVGTGFSDAERASPPPIGSVITFRYQELSKDGVPRFPSYVGIRTDLDWPPEAAAQPRARPAVAKTVVAVSAPTPAAAPRPAKPAGAGARRFEYEDDASSKFWQILVQGASHTVTFGRLGTDGQSKTKQFPDAAAAAADAAKLIAEKTGKGYEEVDPQAVPVPARADADDDLDGDEADDDDAEDSDDDAGDDAEDETDDDAEDSDDDAGDDADVPASGGPWRFELVDGDSSKFWQLEVEGDSHSVTFGRIGTDGQSKSKDFDSPAAARADAAKLISEKLAKGYAEVPVPGLKSWKPYGKASAKPSPAASAKPAPTTPAPAQSAPAKATASAPAASAPAKATANAPAASTPAKASATSAPAPAAPGGRSGPSRYFERTAGSFSSFWEITVLGAALAIRTGRTGTAGQVEMVPLADAAAAQAEADKRIADRLRDGYRERAS